MSEIKVNKISPRTACGTTTLGDSGDTFTIPAGVTITNNGTQTGFGRTGSVNWDTTVKTGNFSAADGNGYFVNTTSGEITVSLPAGSAGNIVAFKDYANTWDSAKVTVTPNGSEKIGGVAENAYLSTESQSVTLIYIDSTRGWIDIHDSTSNIAGAAFIAATGGTITTCGDYKIHTFTGPGTFTVSDAGDVSGSNSVEYLVVAGGGGGGGACISGAGGAGGFRFASPSIAPLTYPAKPLAGPANLPVSATGYPITVGGGGAGSSSPGSPPGNAPQGTNGDPSTFSTITSAGGGGGGGSPAPIAPGLAGGSGGGGAYNGTGGAGNTPPVSPSQGNAGGTQSPATTSPAYGAGGGGGATAAGTSGTPANGGAGGAGGGLPTAFGSNGEDSGGYRYYAGGGGGAGENASAASGGLGGGGDGGFGGSPGTPTQRTGCAGTANTGGGGGGACSGGPSPGYGPGGNGGSGIVVIRYKYQ